MSYLIVVAHPDDEVLGAGGTICKLAQEGNEVHVCILCSQAEARNFRPDVMELQRNTEESANLLGIREVIYAEDKYSDTTSVIASKRMMEAAGVKYHQYQKTDREVTIRL